MNSKEFPNNNNLNDVDMQGTAFQILNEQNLNLNNEQQCSQSVSHSLQNDPLKLSSCPQNTDQVQNFDNDNFLNIQNQEWTFRHYRILEGYLMIFQDDYDQIFEMMNQFSKKEILKRIQFLQNDLSKQKQQKKIEFQQNPKNSTTKPLQNDQNFDNFLNNKKKKDQHKLININNFVKKQDQLILQYTKKEIFNNKQNIDQKEFFNLLLPLRNNSSNDENIFYNQQQKELNNTLMMTDIMKKNECLLEQQFEKFNNSNQAIQTQKSLFHKINNQYNEMKRKIMSICKHNEKNAKNHLDFRSLC